MPITADDFLNALDLPSFHPYVQTKGEDPVDFKPKTISDYFRSVSWDDQKSTKTKDSIHEECEHFPSPPWGKQAQDQHVNICHNKESVSSTEKLPLKNSDSVDILNASAIDFLREIKPCLVSLGRMNLIIWCPLLLLFCFKRLYSSPRKSHNAKNNNDNMESSPPCQNQQMQTMKNRQSSHSSDPSQKSKFYNDCLILPIWKKMTSFSDYLPSSLASTMSQDKYRRDGRPQPNQSSFERILFFSSIITSVMSMMASFSTIFSIDEERMQTNNNDGSINNTSATKEPVTLCKAEEKRRMSEYNTKAPENEAHNDSSNMTSFSLTDGAAAYIIALILSAFIMTDAMYVYEFSQNYLVALHLFIISMATKRFGTKPALWMALPISATAFYVMARQDLNLPTIEPGYYFDESNAFISEVAKEWPVEMRSYDDSKATPWMLTGDTRTGFPFLLNDVPSSNYVRRWVPLPDEQEAVILDIAFPESIEIEEDKQVYLVLHGFNGDSNEGYVLDFVSRQVAKGNIVAVMVTRGLGDSPILGKNILHFARTSDVDAAAKALKKAIKQVGSQESTLTLAGVGYSIGAITLANYVATSGSECNLDVAVGFSGALDTRQQVNFHRSASLWQPFIAKAMRDTVLKKFSKQIRAKFSDDQIRDLMKAQSVIDLDEALFAAYHDFDSLDGYYSKMGAMGDFVGFESKQDEGRIGNVSIPLCMVQALDDPVGYWGTFHDPEKVSRTGRGLVSLLFTRKGGHVGWSQGMNPNVKGWSWMSDVASSYAEAVGRVRRGHAARY